jgi:RNA polymerase sigma factor (sigma-70 family)
MKDDKPTPPLSDEELVFGLLNNDEAIIRHLLFERCTPMFTYIIRSIFDYRADKDELINELYLYLQENDWYKLRQFDYRSKLTTWLSVVAIRFFQKKRETLIENDSDSTLYIEKEKVHDEEAQTIQRIDVAKLLNQLPNERYRYVIHSLIIQDIEPQQLANEMGITVDNLYNIKRRALQQLAIIARKDSGHEK